MTGLPFFITKLAMPAPKFAAGQKSGRLSLGRCRQPAPTVGQQYRCDRNAQQMLALLKEELGRKQGEV